MRLRGLLSLTGVALAATAGFGLAPGPALAYQGCNSRASMSASPDHGRAGQRLSIRASFRGCDGRGEAGLTVRFSQQSGPDGRTVGFDPSTTTTNQAGDATSSATLPADGPGDYTLAATAGSVTVVVTVTESGGYPNNGPYGAAGAQTSAGSGGPGGGGGTAGPGGSTVQASPAVPPNSGGGEFSLPRSGAHGPSSNGVGQGLAFNPLILGAALLVAGGLMYAARRLDVAGAILPRKRR